MTNAQFEKNLSVPTGRVDVILDTDAYNEVDDQFAIAYLLHAEERVNLLGFCAAPFFNSRSVSPADGMKKSYDEIKKLLQLAGREDLCGRVYRGSEQYLSDEKTPVFSDAARFLAETARGYTPQHPLYVVAIGAITNVASALLSAPEIAENIVIVWLGGHAHHWRRQPAGEFNMTQDIAAACVVFGSGAPLVQLPCAGVVDHFIVTEAELQRYMLGKNPLSDYLAKNVLEAQAYAAGQPWGRVIWDVTAAAWLLNDGERFMQSVLTPPMLPTEERGYEPSATAKPIRYVYAVDRTALLADMFRRIAGEERGA